jgi:very-short-patch-repair endonuclease
MRNKVEGARALAALSSRQYGLVSHAQAVAAGLNRMDISRRVRAGLWRAVHPRVFSTAPASESMEQRALAACLWLGGEAVVSHRSAALLWGLRLSSSAGMALRAGGRADPEVTTARSGYRVVKGLVIHGSTDLSADDHRVRRGIPVTSVARTLIDLASCLDEEQVAYSVDEAWRKHLASPDWVERRLRPPVKGRRGAKALARVLADCWLREHALESALEVRLWRFLRRAKLPLPVPGFQFEDDFGQPGRIDFAYPAQRLALEADGFEFHGDRASFERDRSRVARLSALGWRVLPVTWRQLDEQPHKVLELVRRALAFAEDTRAPWPTD